MKRNKLQLNRETLRALDNASLRSAMGGVLSTPCSAGAGCAERTQNLACGNQGVTYQCTTTGDTIKNCISSGGCDPKY